jgi:hypothetical protein
MILGKLEIYGRFPQIEERACAFNTLKNLGVVALLCSPFTFAEQSARIN